MKTVLLKNPSGRIVDVPDNHPAIDKARDGIGGWSFAESDSVSEKGAAPAAPDPDPVPARRGPGRPRKNS